MKVHKYACEVIDIGIEIREGAAEGRPLPHLYKDIDNFACIFMDLHGTAPYTCTATAIKMVST